MATNQYNAKLLSEYIIHDTGESFNYSSVVFFTYSDYLLCKNNSNSHQKQKY